MDHSATRVGHGQPHHPQHHAGSHVNLSHYRDHHGHAPTLHGTHVTHARDSHSNVARNQRHSHVNIAPHMSSVSQGSRGENISIYNMPREAVEDYRNLMMKASHSAQHPGARDPHHRHADIPHSHQPRGHFRKSRQKLLALHLLANKQRQEAAARQEQKIDPVDTLMCRYLRLSALNVETLVEMCNESGIDIGIHPHMSIDDVANFVFQNEEKSVLSPEIENGTDGKGPIDKR